MEWLAPNVLSPGKARQGKYLRDGETEGNQTHRKYLCCFSETELCSELAGNKECQHKDEALRSWFPPRTD